MSINSNHDVPLIPAILDKRIRKSEHDDLRTAESIGIKNGAAPSLPDHPQLGRPTDVFSYHDDARDLAFMVARYAKDGGGKEIRFYCPPTGLWKLPEGQRPLYRLAEVLADDGPVIVVEGEKCVDALRLAGINATTSSGGASSAAKSDWAAMAGHDVTIWPDNDDAGDRYSKSVADALAAAGARSIAILSIEQGALKKAWGDDSAYREPAIEGEAIEERGGLPKGWDAADAITDGWPVARLQDLISLAVPVTLLGEESGRHDITVPSNRNAPEPDLPHPASNENWPDISLAEDQDSETNFPPPPAYADPPRSGAGVPHGFRVSSKGVFHINDDGEESYLCPRLDVVALTRDADGSNWGVMLEFVDAEMRPKRWAAPKELLAGDASTVCASLLHQGLQIVPTLANKRNLIAYIAGCKPDRIITGVSRTGWHDENYVLPDVVFGADDSDSICLQSIAAVDHAYAARGTLQQWQSEIGAQCVCNSRLVFAVSTAFAAPLLTPLELEGGGFHFLGSSSTGKTTALRVAASVWGGGSGSGYIRNWRATANGLESVAHGHNDALLCLDELGQISERDAGQVAYMLANGEGKSRARKDGLGRPPLRWCLLFLSTGEQSLADKLREGGRRIHAGQETRMIDLQADAGHGLGMFETLHGHKNGAALSRHLTTATKNIYGAPILAFLDRLARIRDDAALNAKKLAREFLNRNLPPNADGQVSRVAQRVALIAAAGELAIRIGILPWPQGEAIRGAETCFTSWLDNRGGIGSSEDAVAVRQVRLFIQQHGESRFSDWTTSDDDRATHNRAGFRRTKNGRHEYLILNEVFKSEVCASLNPKAVVAALRGQELLLPDSQGKSTRPVHLPGYDRAVRVYCLSGSILGETAE